MEIADWRDALTWAAGRDEFDPNAGFGIWGSSFAGGLALVVAANDPRVRCVAVQIPHVSGHRNAAGSTAMTSLPTSDAAHWSTVWTGLPACPPR